MEWQDATCPECRGKFKYPKGGYRPPTCKKFVRNHLHPELKRRVSNANSY